MRYDDLEDAKRVLRDSDLIDIFVVKNILEFMIDEIEKLQPPKQCIYQCLERGKDPIRYELIFSSDVKSDAVKWVKEYPNKRCFHERLE